MGLLDKIGVGKVLNRFKKNGGDDDDYDDYEDWEDEESFDISDLGDVDPDQDLRRDKTPEDGGEKSALGLDGLNLDGADEGGEAESAPSSGEADETADSPAPVSALDATADAPKPKGAPDDISDDEIDDDDIPDFDLDGDEDWEEEDEEGEEGAGEGGGMDPRQMALIGAGLFVLIAIFGGAGWWFLGDSEGDTPPAVAEDEQVPMATSLIPPKAGRSLNALGRQSGTKTADGAGGAGSNTGEVASAPGQPLLNPDGTPMAQELSLTGPVGPGEKNNLKTPGGGVIIPNVGQRTFDLMPMVKIDKSLSVVPDMKLVQQTENGLIPVVGKDGRQPWKVYARPFDGQAEGHRLALILTGMGLSTAATDAAISRMPGAVTLAFSPYAQGLEDWVVKARDAGHEVLLELPLQPDDFPFADPGSYALMAYGGAEENLTKLNFLLTRMVGYTGLLTIDGSKYVSRDDLMLPLLEALKARGLMYVEVAGGRKSLSRDIGAQVGIPRVFGNIQLGQKPSKYGVDDSLDSLEMTLNSKGPQVAVMRPYPMAMERLALWVQKLQQKKIILAPVSALADTTQTAPVEKPPVTGPVVTHEAAKPKPEPEKAPAH